MLTRFARFNAVGIVGFALQVAVLTLLVRVGLPVVVATLVAVEAAVLHNFAWHERWTWRNEVAHERAQRARASWTTRLARFHLTNGLMSLAGNALLTTALARTGVPLALASLSAVAVCALGNFAFAHLFVFSSLRPLPRGSTISLLRLPRNRRSSTRAWLRPRTRAAPSSSRAHARTI